MDLSGNQLQNVVIDKQESNPGSGTAGRIIYVTADNKLKYYNGTSWVALTTSESGEYQLLSQKNQASGYAGLDSSGKLAIAQVPTGVAADTVPLLKAAISNGQGIKYDSASGGFVPFDVSTLYNFKGSTTSAELDTFTATAQTGDVYNLSDSRSWNSGTYPAGTNWAFESTGSGAGNWEPLTGIMDLSGYQTVSNMVTSWQGTTDNSHYPSEKLVKDALDVLTAGVAAAVVANGSISPGTHTKITYDAKGLVTAGSDLQAGDIPDLSSAYIAVSRLGTDVAQLVSGKVPVAQLPTGNGENLIPLLPNAGTAGQAIVVNSNADGFAFRTVPDHSMSRVSFQITGDGTTATFNQAINFDGELPSSVTIFDTSGNIIYADVQCTTSQVTVSMTPAPQTGENYTVRIVG